jgi:uncharacterized protein involved in exopolysaccharide biosynthesis
MFDLLRILMKWRRPLFGLALLGALAGGIYAFTVAPRYYAQASILPPPQEPSFGGLSSLLEQYSIPMPGGVHSPFLPTLYASIVSSRRMGKLILDEFDLRQEFGTDNEDDALATLRGFTKLDYTDDGLFLVGFEDRDAKRAADVVNSYVHHLDEIIQEVNSSRARQTRTFVESQINRSSDDLKRAEEALRDFQRQHHAVQIDAQTEGAIDLAATLQGQILATEVQLRLLKERARPASQEVQQKESELAALKSEYAKLTGTHPEIGSQPGEAGAGGELFPKFETVPDLALQYMRLMRDLKVQETLYGMLVQQLEQARIEEQKNTPVLSVLDWAEPTSRPVYPRKLLILLAAALAGAAWVAIIAVVVEKLRVRRPEPDEAEALAALRDEWDRMPRWVRRIERLVVR